MTEFGMERWLTCSTVEFNDVQPADFVRQKNNPAVILGDIIGPRRGFPRGRLRDEVALLDRMQRIADIDYAQPCREPGDVKHAVRIDAFAQLMGAEADVVTV